MAVIYILKTNFSSSNVAGFTKSGRNLIVEFLNGSRYMYLGAAKVYYGMLRTGSKGKYVWRVIRDIFPYQRIN